MFEDLGMRLLGRARARHPAAHQTFEFLKTQHEAGPPAHSHAKGQRLCAGAGTARQIPRTRQIRAQDGQDGLDQVRPPTASSSARRCEVRRHQPTRSSPSPAPCLRAPASSILPRCIPTKYFDVGIARNTPRSSPAVWPRQGYKAVPRHFTRPSCSAPTT